MNTIETIAAWLVLLGLAGLLVAAVAWLALVIFVDLRQWLQARQHSRRLVEREAERLRREASDSVLRIQAAYWQAREELRHQSTNERR